MCVLVAIIMLPVVYISSLFTQGIKFTTQHFKTLLANTSLHLVTELIHNPQISQSLCM